jgi:glycosyltransferase involved in cell wall biosynthesis
MLQRSGLHPNTFNSLWTMRHYLPEKDRLVSMFPMDRPQASARSDAFKLAREVDADALLFIDSDMEFEPDLYQRLLAVDADIACGLFWTKRIPSFPTVMRRVKAIDGTDSLANIIPDGKIVEIDACGMAATLIRRPVLQSKRFEGRAAFQHLGDIGEDYYFCLHARDEGFTIKCDTSLQVAHRGDVAFNGQPILTHPDLKTLSYPFGGQDGVEQGV